MRINRAHLSLLWLMLVIGMIGAREVAAFDVAMKSPLNDPDNSSLVSPIDRLKRRLTEEQITDHVVLKFKFIELSMDQFCKLTQGNRAWMRPNILNDDAVKKSWGLPGYSGLQSIDSNPDVQAWLTPEICVIAGHEAKFSLGERHPFARTNEDGEVTTTDAEDSRSVIAKASILSCNRVRVAVEGVFQNLTKRCGSQPNEDCRRIQASFEMNQGETQAFGRTVVSSSGKETFILVLATAWIKQFAIPDDPAATPISAVDDVSHFDDDAAKIKGTSWGESTSNGAVERKVRPVNTYTEDLLVGDSNMTPPPRSSRTIRIADQVQLSLEVVELNPAGLDAESLLGRRRSYGFRPAFAPVEYWKSLMTDFIEIESEHPFSPYPKSNHHAAYFSFDEIEAWPTYRHQDLVAMWRSHPSSRVWTFSQIHATSDDQFECYVGGETPILKMMPNGSEAWRSERFGASIDATASIDDLEYVRLSLSICLKDLEETASGLKVSNARRSRSKVQIHSGQAIYVGQPVVSELGHETFLCIRIVAQILPRPLSLERTAVPEIDTDDVVSALQPDNASRLDAQSSIRSDHATGFTDAIHLASWTETITKGSRFERIDRICKLTRWRSYSLVDDPELLPNSGDLGHNSLIGHKNSELEYNVERRGWTGQSQLQQWQRKPKFRGFPVYYYDD